MGTKEDQARAAYEKYLEGYTTAIRNSAFLPTSCSWCMQRDGETLSIESVMSGSADHDNGQCTFTFLKPGKGEYESLIAELTEINRQLDELYVRLRGLMGKYKGMEEELALQKEKLEEETDPLLKQSLEAYIAQLTGQMEVINTQIVELFPMIQTLEWRKAAILQRLLELE